MRRRTDSCIVCVCLITLSILYSGLSVELSHSDSALSEGSFYPAASGWLAGWEYRKGHDVAGSTGAGTNYQVGIKTYYDTVLRASNAADASLSNSGYLAENIVYDSNTSMYWWIFEDRSSDPVVVKIAYATSINRTWTVQSTPVIMETGHYCIAPYIAQFGSYWYIYYGRALSNSNENVDVWVQKSSYVNQSYSTSGITNPVLAKGSDGSWDSSRAFEPCIYFENGTYYLFYMGQNGTIGQSTDSSNYERVGYATSSSPTSGFTKFSGNPILPADNWPHGWDAGSDQAADPFVFKYSDTYYIGVSAVSAGHMNTGQIGFYTSKDFVAFTHYAENPVLGHGQSGNWDAEAAARGAVTNFNGTLYLAYAGFNGSNWGCGLTTLSARVEPDEGEQVFLNGNCRTDFGDVRFTGNDGTTLLNYWMESEVEGFSASFWVQVAGDLGSANQTIYVYYGNSSATTTSNGNNTFLFFDDFSGSPSRWLTNSGTWNVANGDLTIEPTPDYNYLVSANSVGTSNIAIKTRVMSEPAGDIQAHPGIVWHANNLTGASQKNDQVYFRPHNSGSSDWANIQPAYYSNRIVTWHDDKFGSYFDWNVWYRIEVRIPSSGNVTLYGNDAYWHGWSNQQYSYDHLGFVAHDSGQNYWDYILVRKYVNPEPSHGNWGSEETARLTFGSINANTTVAGSSVQLSCLVSSGSNVSFYVYSWNNTGSWTNQTATPFTNFINSTAAYATLTGTWSTTAGHTISAIVYANDTNNNWNASSQYNFTITPASTLKFVFTSGTNQSLSAGQLSGQVIVQRRDQYGNTVTSGSVTVNLTSTSLGAKFYSDAGNTLATSVVIVNGSSTVSFWYTDTSAGSPTLTGSAAGLTPATTTFTITQAPTPPTYSNISISSTFAGQTTTFSSEWNDTYGLSGYIFSTNNTGLWQNTTWTPFSGTPALANVTQNLNSNINMMIAYIWYANNTNQLWNNTEIQTLTTNALNLIPFSIVSNSTISKLAFNSTSEVLEFTVSGPSGTFGFTNVTIAKTIISEISTLTVYLDGNQMNYTVTDLTNSWSIYFIYHHSTHSVAMEFAPQQTKTSATRPNEVLLAIIGPSIIIPTTLAITIQRKRKSRNSKKRKSAPSWNSIKDCCESCRQELHNSTHAK